MNQHQINVVTDMAKELLHATGAKGANKRSGVWWRFWFPESHKEEVWIADAILNNQTLDETADHIDYIIRSRWER
jgi:hypothetical protein